MAVTELISTVCHLQEENYMTEKRSSIVWPLLRDRCLKSVLSFPYSFHGIGSGVHIFVVVVTSEGI